MRYNSNCACSSVELECNSPKVEVARLNRVKRTIMKKQRKCLGKFAFFLILLGFYGFFIKTTGKKYSLDTEFIVRMFAPLNFALCINTYVFELTIGCSSGAN